VNLPFFIAKRYLIARKSHNLINIITLISVVGVGVGAFALIVVLSVFNGFEKVISSLVNSVSPHLLIEPQTGKTIDTRTFPAEKLKQINGVLAVSAISEEDALIRHNEKQHIGRVKGVEDIYTSLGHFDPLMTEGIFSLGHDDTPFAVAGSGVGWFLGLNVSNPASVITLFVPKRGKASVMSFEQSFNSLSIQPIGIFSSQQDYDARYVLVPLGFANELLGYTDEVTAYEVFLHKAVDEKRIKKQISRTLGNEFRVRDRYEQQETLYRIMRSEKWAIFIILTFILIMATFNIIGSLTMIIVDKRKDISVLGSLGAGKKLINKLFLTEGMLISVAGGITGLIAGIVLVLLQQQFGLLKLGNEGGSFIIEAYPVSLQALDILLVFITVLIIGLLSSAYTVWQSLKRLGRETIRKS